MGFPGVSIQTPVAATRRTKGQRTRDAILGVAVERAVRVGVGGLTLGDLATELGMSKSGLYAHFGSIEALQVAVLDHAGLNFAERVIVPALGRPRGERRLRALADAWILTCRDGEPNGCLFVKSSTEFDGRPGPIRDRLQALHLQFHDSLTRVVGGGVTTGEFDPGLDVDRFAHDWYALMLGFYHAHRLLDDPLAEARARTSLDRLVDAARPPGPTPSGSPAGNGTDDPAGDQA